MPYLPAFETPEWIELRLLSLHEKRAGYFQKRNNEDIYINWKQVREIDQDIDRCLKKWKEFNTLNFEKLIIGKR